MSRTRAPKARTSPAVSPVGQILIAATALMNEATRFAVPGRRPRRSELMKTGREAIRLLEQIDGFAAQVNQSTDDTNTFSGHMYERVLSVLDFVLNRLKALGALTDFTAVVSA